MTILSSKYDLLQTRLILFIGLIFLFMFSLSVGIDEVSFNSDEVRTALRAQGTLLQTVLWQPPDWPPLHNLLINLVGNYFSDHPDILRFVSILMLLPSIPLMFQIARRFYATEQAALLSMIAYCSLGYVSYLATLLRGYGLVLSIFTLLFYLSLRYFDGDKRPKIIVSIALTIALAFYTTYTSLIAFMVLGLYTLLRYRQEIWRWVFPATLALLLVLPQLLSFVGVLLNRADTDEAVPLSLLPPEIDSMLLIYRAFLGSVYGIWGGIIGIALVCLLIYHREAFKRWQIAWLVITIIFAPIFAYLAHANGIFFRFDERYVWWGIIPIALLVGGGLSYLPIDLNRASILVFGILIFFPTPYHGDKVAIPVERTFQAVAQDIQNGDGAAVDSSLCISSPCDFFHTWTYYYSYYFGNDVTILANPDDHRHIWYFYQQRWQDDTTLSVLSQGRAEGRFHGNGAFGVQEYVAPPNPQGILFDNGIRFHGVDILDDNGRSSDDIALREQEAVDVRLWWSIEAPLANEYSVSLQVMDEAGNLIAQTDQAPQLAKLDPDNPFLLPETMTGWQPNTMYTSERTLQLPDLGDPTPVAMYLVIYQWWDGVRISSPSNNELEQLELMRIEIQGW